MADHAVDFDQSRSYSSMKGSRDTGRGKKTQNGPNTLLKLGRSVNPFKNDKKHEVSSKTQTSDDNRLSNFLSISPKHLNQSTTKIPKDDISDVFQKSSKNVLPEKLSCALALSMGATRFYKELQSRLNFVFDSTQDEVYSIPRLIHAMIYHPDGNQVRTIFFEIYSNYRIHSEFKSFGIEDEHLVEIIVEAMKFFPASTHGMTMDSIAKLTGSDGVKMINIATVLLQKKPQDQIVQVNFHPFLKKGIDIILQDKNSPERKDGNFSSKVHNFINVDFSNHEHLKQVLIDGLGCCLTHTSIFNKAFSVLKVEKFDHIVTAYSVNVESIYAASTLVVFIEGLHNYEFEQLFAVLIKYSKMHMDNSQLVVSLFQAIQNYVRKKGYVDKAQRSNAFKTILDISLKNLSTVDIVLLGFNILTNLGIPDAQVESFVVKSIFQVLKEHQKLATLKEAVFPLLSQVESPENVEAVISLFKQETISQKNVEKIYVIIFSAFAQITREEKKTGVFVREIPAEEFLEIQWRYSDNVELQEKYCVIVSNLLKCKKMNRKFAETHVGCVVEIMRKFPNDMPSQEAAFVALANFSSQFLEVVLSCDVVGLVVMGMVTHTDVAKIQETGCAILANVSPTSDIYQFGGVDCILIAMAKHSDKKEVQSAACKALSVLYESQNQEAFENLPLVQPLLDASRKTFPRECEDVVDGIMQSIENHKVTIGKNQTPRNFSTGTENPSCQGITRLGVSDILPSDQFIDYAHKVIFVGGQESTRTDVIQRIVNSDFSAIYRLRKERDNLGLMDYAWQPYKNSAHKSKSDMMIYCLDFAQNVPPGLFFSQQATYVLLWDVSKIFTPDHNSVMEEEYNDPIEAGLKLHTSREEDFKKAIDENIIYWTDLIHDLMPNAQIYCLGVNEDTKCDREADREKCHMVRMRFEELTFKRMSRGQGGFRANVVFEVGGESIIYEEKNSPVLTGLRNRLLITTENEQEADVFMFDPVAELGTNHVIQAVRQLGRSEVMMSWQQLLRTIRNQLEGEDTSLDVALHILLSYGDIRTFKSLERPEDEIVLLNNEWLIERARCIIQEGYQELTLSIQEAKEDFCLNDWIENDFCKICIHCPVISSEDSELLWESMESDKNVSFSINCLEQVLSCLGVLIPLSSTKKESESKIFFVPGLLESGEPPGWSFKSSNPNIGLVCNAWVIEGNVKPNFMTKVITSVLNQLLINIERSKQSLGANPNLPVWCTLSEERHRDALSRFIFHEICCWKTSILIKVEMEVSDSKQEKRIRNMGEFLIHLGDRSSPLCISSNSLKRTERRISISFKGSIASFNGLGSIIYDRLLASIERVLKSSPSVHHRKEIICPDCLEDYPLADACVLDWSYIHECCTKTVSCERGHNIGIESETIMN